jgi:hypothetical protein
MVFERHRQSADLGSRIGQVRDSVRQVAGGDLGGTAFDFEHRAHAALHDEVSNAAPHDDGPIIKSSTIRWSTVVWDIGQACVMSSVPVVPSLNVTGVARIVARSNGDMHCPREPRSCQRDALRTPQLIRLRA